MASQHMLLLAVTAAAIAVLRPAMAAEIVVGDQSGWQPDFDYSTWVQGMDFRVGDKLVFSYAPGKQNVVEVAEAGYRACTAVGGNKTLETGHDMVPLETSGRKWFICSKGDHCRRGGQKLQIDVIPAIVTRASLAPLAPPPPPPPPLSSPADAVRPNTLHAVLAAGAALTMMVVSV